MNHDDVRKKLLELRQELTARHQRIDKQIHNRDEPRSADSGERAGETSNDETMELLDAGAQAELRQIDHALWQLDTGTFGRCESCRKSIPEERLELVPFATKCVACAAAN